MRIALFTDSYTPYVSGVVRSIQRFSQQLLAQGHEVYIFAPDYPNRKVNGEVQILSQESATKVFRFYSVPAPTHPSFTLPIPISPKADGLIKELQIDIIHTHSPFLMGQLGAVLAKRHGTPLVFTHHTLYHEYIHYVPAFKRFTKQMIINFLHHYCNKCTHIIAPTPYIKDMIIDLYKIKRPVSAIPTGIDLKAYQGDQINKDWLKNKLGIPASHQVILFVGRLGKEKNVDIVIDSFKIINECLSETALVFVGEGPELKRLKERASSLGLDKKVYFTGLLDSTEIVNAYYGADIFLFGSITETQGLVTVEAMAAGLPVVAVNATGTRDIVMDGFNGFLTANNAQQLAERTIEVLKTPELYQDLRKNALTTAQEYSLENTTRILLQAYENALKNPILAKPRRYAKRKDK
ncbi:MAG: glycosyltransferase family 4 protein [Firmicutes bacterium]|nr:glycosyltransferase family 4 protein [Bacillota bacterium]